MQPFTQESRNAIKSRIQDEENARLAAIGRFAAQTYLEQQSRKSKMLEKKTSS